MKAEYMLQILENHLKMTNVFRVINYRGTRFCCCVMRALQEKVLEKQRIDVAEV